MMVDNIRWAAYMEIIYSLPPDPMFTENWKDEWLSRLDALDPCVNKWMPHLLKDDYFKQGSVSEDYSRIKVASFLIGGMADIYSENVMRCTNLLASFDNPPTMNSFPNFIPPVLFSQPLVFKMNDPYLFLLLSFLTSIIYMCHV